MLTDIRKPLKKILPHLLKAQEENLSEADTVQRLVKVFEEVLDYDVMTEITREAQVKDKYVDIAVKIDGAIRFLVEAKSAGTVLRDRHLEQAQRYAAEGNIRWVILTNGIAWNMYHLTFEEGIEYEKVFSVDLSSDPFDKAAEFLALLHRNSIRAGAHEEFWEKRVALGPESISRALFSEDVLRFIRRLIRKNEGILIDPEDLAAALHQMLSTEARERIGPMRIYKRRKTRSKKEETVPSDAGIKDTGSQPENPPKS